VLDDLRHRLLVLLRAGLKQQPALTLIGAFGFVLIMGALVMPVSASISASSRSLVSIPLEVPPLGRDEALAIPNLEGDLTRVGDGYDGWQVVTVRRNETLGNIFERLGLGQNAVYEAVSVSDKTQELAKIFPGEQIAFLIVDGKLQGLQFDASEAERVVLSRVAGSLEQHLISRRLETRLRFATAEISSSLFNAGQQAEISDLTVMKLAEAFNYDIDFAGDIQPGDRFAIVFEEIWRDGEKLRDGNILAAMFVNGGKRFEIYRFTDANGRSDFYGADGRSRAKAFIRTPLEFTRISSRFSLGRKHPILGRMRAHRGVDYAAPTGTPIKATGNGTVSFLGWQNGYGNVITLKHGNQYTTVYGHMSRFAKGLKRGSKVDQNQVIGYVGMTGLATGPHLHYEFRVGGQHRDPLSVDLPVADPLGSKQLAQFKLQTAPLIAQLRTLESTLLAKAR
jgi:murein DD-endopeptidase MepM/ murein hydrolase activator NlpD